MESEIQRKKEHINFATNFQKSRGFVRTNWKSKNWKPEDDPCGKDSSTDESEIERRAAAEQYDDVDDDISQSRKMTRMKTGSKDTTPEPMNELIDYSS